MTATQVFHHHSVSFDPFVMIFFLDSLHLNSGYLEHGEGFVASTSDFWSAPKTQEPYGATIANFMAKKYRQKNGLCTFMSDKAHDYIVHKEIKSELLCISDPVVDRCQALVDFRHFPEPKTGEKICKWLEIAHGEIACKPKYMFSHITDNGKVSIIQLLSNLNDSHIILFSFITLKCLAGNATKSVQTLQLSSSAVSSVPLIGGNCDGHSNNLTTMQASGISNHKINLNEGLKIVLDKLHATAVRMCQGSKRKEVLMAVRKEHGRKKVWPVTFSARTRWDGVHEETKMASINQRDLDVAVNRCISYSGIDSDIYDQNRDDLGTVLFNAND